MGAIRTGQRANRGFQASNLFHTKGNINLNKWARTRKKHFIRVWPKQTDKIHAQLHPAIVNMASEW